MRIKKLKRLKYGIIVTNPSITPAKMLIKDISPFTINGYRVRIGGITKTQADSKKIKTKYWGESLDDE